MNAPIILADGQNIEVQKEYLDTTGYKNLILIGGTVSINDKVQETLGSDPTVDQ
ncbi:cell wall-binding repeat-containing protein [Clostridium sp. LBM24168]